MKLFSLSKNIFQMKFENSNTETKVENFSLFQNSESWLVQSQSEKVLVNKGIIVLGFRPTSHINCFWTLGWSHKKM